MDLDTFIHLHIYIYTIESFPLRLVFTFTVEKVGRWDRSKARCQHPSSLGRVPDTGKGRRSPFPPRVTAPARRRGQIDRSGWKRVQP